MESRLIKLLRQQVKPAIGCTEPIAVAIAVAKAREVIDGDIESIDVLISPSIYKNGYSVTIPGTNKKGNAYAAALSSVVGKSEYGLEVLKDVEENNFKEADEMLSKVNIRFDISISGVYVKATIKTDKGISCVEIKDTHDNIVSVISNDKTLFSAEQCNTNKENNFDIRTLTVMDLRKEIENIPSKDLMFMLDGVKMNLTMSKEGLDKKVGIGVGATLKELIDNKTLADNLPNRARMMSAAATDARMGGIKLPVMSSAGSGNHGITAVIPIKIVADEKGISDEKLVKAIAFSHLITYFVKTFTGRLSPICGCAIAAGVGSTAGITWMLGGSDEEIASAINNIIGNISGLVCDGAKDDCALKIATSASEAVMASLMALQGVTMTEQNGIVDPDVNKTIKNLGSICEYGMSNMDEEILKVIM